MAKLRNILPRVRPILKETHFKNPYLAPTDIASRFAGPGVPTISIINAHRLNNTPVSIIYEARLRKCDNKIFFLKRKLIGVTSSSSSSAI